MKRLAKSRQRLGALPNPLPSLRNERRRIAPLLFALLAAPIIGQSVPAAGGLTFGRTADFEVDGRGTADAWQDLEWIELVKRNDYGRDYRTRCKLLHSDSGLYFLFECEDDRITSTLREDFADIFREDVIEVFLWPDEGSPLYFEYELSPANFELVLLIPNFNGEFLGWRPWHYEGDRRTRHQTQVVEKNGLVIAWTAEFFIPYDLMRPLQNVPPSPGSHWRVNLYRADFDTGERAIWSWMPFAKRFHEYEKFGYAYFED